MPEVGNLLMSEPTLLLAQACARPWGAGFAACTHNVRQVLKLRLQANARVTLRRWRQSDGRRGGCSPEVACI
eukprot:3394713-Pleurochrysis_carterae.AAC.1